VIVVGLTGSIGMGKSTASAMFRQLGVPVYDADVEVHKIFAKGGAAVPAISAAFPDAIVEGAVDRTVLSRLAVDDPSVFRTLEIIVHPIVRGIQDHLIRVMCLRRAPMLVLDIPLLFETGGEQRCDLALVVSAPGYLQAQRVLARADMTVEKFHAILARQTPDGEKRRLGDVVIPSNRGMAAEFRQIAGLVRAIRAGRRPANHRVTTRRQPSGFRRLKGPYRPGGNRG
jgi:dephospho-CoA kinase